MKTLFRFASAASVSLIFLFAGCSSLIEDAERGIVRSQYKLAHQFKKENNPEQAFRWMKRAADSRFRPAMREVAGYYLRGYGHKKDVAEAGKWLRRYLAVVPDSEFAFESAKEILNEATGKEAMEGLILIETALMLEYENSSEHSERVQKIVAEIKDKMRKICIYWLEHSSPQDAREVIQYCQKIAEAYPMAFPEDFYIQLDEVSRMIESGKIKVGTKRTKKASEDNKQNKKQPDIKNN